MGTRSWQHACIALIVATYLLELSQAQNCKAGWYGSECEYKCHCVDNRCYTSGQCDTTLCEHGWFGPGCQYDDLTPKARIQLNFPGESVLVTDVQHGTCLWDPAVPGLSNVTFTFDETYPLTWFSAVFNGSDSNDEALEVTFRQTNKDGSSTKLDCTNRTQFSISDTVLDIHCHVTQSANQVILSGSGIESLCSFHISGGRNVALKQNTSQSSTYESAQHKIKPRLSMYAVDGDTRANAQVYNCTHTLKDADSVWRVNLSQPEMVTRYVIFSRDDGHLERLRGFVLESLDSNGSALFKYQDKASGTQTVYIISVPPSTEQEPVSSVVITKHNEFLTLCEVELYSECPLGTYGLNCQQTCRAACAGGSCEPVQGYCHHCPAGKQGLYCDEDCDESHHGPNCEQSCSKTCEGERCDPVTGHCISCPPGKRGELCYQVCANKTYGIACGKVCSPHCRTDEVVEPAVCHPTTGTCLLGCQAGYQGLTCTEEISYLGAGTVIGLDILFLCILVAAAAAGWYYWQKRKAAQGKPKHNYDALDQEQAEMEPREIYDVTFRSLREAEERADVRAEVRADERTEEKAEERAETPIPSKEESEDGDTYEEVAQPLLSRSAPKTVATSTAPPQEKAPPPPSEIAPPPPVLGAGNGGALAPMGYDQVPKYPTGSKKMVKDVAQEEDDGEQLYENL